MAWTVTRIKQEIRDLTGRPSTTQISEAVLLNRINDFYTNVFPSEVMVKDYVQYFTFNTVASTGTKALSAIDSDIINVVPPVYLDGDEISFWVDDGLFFQSYPHSNTDEGEPSDILLFDNTLYIRPIPDAVYEVRVKSTSARPDAFTLDTETPDDDLWGPFIAHGTAIGILQKAGEDEEADRLKDLYVYHLSTINDKYVKQTPLGKRAAPRF